MNRIVVLIVAAGLLGAACSSQWVPAAIAVGRSGSRGSVLDGRSRQGSAGAQADPWLRPGV